MNALTASEAIEARRTARDFDSRPIDEQLLERLLALANRAPSGFNLQPWHFVVVRDKETRTQLRRAAMDQRQVEEAPVVVVFVASPGSPSEHYEQVLERSRASGALPPEAIKMYRNAVKLLFMTGPLGLIGLGKRIAVPIARMFRPVPNVIASSAGARAYVSSQTMLAAATFMIAAKAAGIDTNPMEGFDESRVKRLLGIPARMSVPIMIAAGYGLDSPDRARSVRLELPEKLHHERW